MSFCFVHAADLHLDTPFKGLAAADGRIAECLRDASLDSFDALVELALARRAAFVLLAGDIYDGENRGVRAQLRFLKGLERLSAAEISVFIVHGNHDPITGWTAIRQWPPGVKVFGHSDVECCPVEVSGHTLAHIYGISYGRRDVTENLALRFRRRQGEGLHIGLLHCNVGSNSEHDNYSPCQMEDLARAGMNYWALGHLHRRPAAHPRDPWVVYPGNLQGRSPKPSECGPKGAVVVEADPTGVRNVEFVPLDKARYVQTELQIVGISDLAGLQQALEQRAEELKEENGDRLLLVRTILTGGGEVHSDLTPDRLEELLAELRRSYADARPMLYWESIANQTNPDLNLAAIRDRGDFLAEVLRCSETLGAQEEPLRQFCDQHLADMSPRLVRLRDELELLDDRTVLDRACIVALEMLQREADE